MVVWIGKYTQFINYVGLDDISPHLPSVVGGGGLHEKSWHLLVKFPITPELEFVND
jgi:hypothetical protein